MSAFVQGFSLGQGNGPGIAIKDCIDVAGFPTRAGSPALAGAPPAACHADAVAALLEAGWRIAGKTTMHELAYGMTGINHWAGTPVNPQDRALIPGGSSSGSAAAVGSSEVEAALGSDTGGSIRLPAACCGVIGFKPSFGRVSRRGALPPDSSLDCIGPFARNMRMISRVMAAICKPFDLDIATLPQARARVGVVATDSDPAILAAVMDALGHTLWERIDAGLPGMEAAFEAGLTVINAETWAAFGHLAGAAGGDVARRLQAASHTRPEDRQAAERVRLAFTAEVDRALAQVDALVLPTLPTLPPTLAEVAAGRSVIGLSALVRPFNLSGHPALSFPIPVPALAASGQHDLKAGLQLVGRKGEDERLCALALHLEQALARPDH